ncbi:unnamed protein product [Mytilus coruscus]|uniref:Uncharacterized protein n=1 Tax=Mytilus coruscus TaxID=42192 RepID=A0A6J8B8P7_MYTCO|nr:unnamed protein product [Mytilus coruscus]
MYPSRAEFFVRKFEEATKKPFGHLLVDLKPRTPESSRLLIEVLNIGKGDAIPFATTSQDGKIEKDDLTDTFEDDISDTSEENISNSTENYPIGSEDSEIKGDREDLIACRDCGVVFAHIRGLEAHSQKGCGKKTAIAFPMTGSDVEDTLIGLPVTVCSADDLPTYLSDRPRMFVVNTDKCDQKGSHWVAFHFPASDPPEFFDSLGQLPETYKHYFRNLLIVNGPQYCVVNNRIQPDDSETCGLYCIYYVKLRCRGLKMEDILNNFS